MATKPAGSEAVGASFSTSINGILTSVSMARIAIEDRDKIIADLQTKLAIRDKAFSDLQTTFLSKDRIYNDMKAKLAIKDKALSDLQAKLASKEKAANDLQVKNDNLSSYLSLLNQTLVFLVSKDLPVSSSKYKALSRSFQVDCVICNDQRLVLWKLLPLAPKADNAPSEELLVRVMKHFAGKGKPSFGPVTARVDSIDSGAGEASSELGKRRREGETEKTSTSSTTKIAGVMTDHRSVVPSEASAVPSLSAAEYQENDPNASSSSAATNVGSTTVAVPTTSANPPTTSAVVTTVPASTTEVTKPAATTSTSTTSVRPLPLTSHTSTTTTTTGKGATITTAVMPPPPPQQQQQAKPVATMPTSDVATEDTAPPGPLSLFDTAMAVGKVFDLSSTTSDVTQWVREKHATQNALSAIPLTSNPAVGSSASTASQSLSTSEQGPDQKRRRSSVQPLPLSELRGVAKVSASLTPPVVLDLTASTNNSETTFTKVGSALVPAKLAAGTVPVAAPSVPALPVTHALPNRTAPAISLHISKRMSVHADTIDTAGTSSTQTGVVTPSPLASTTITASGATTNPSSNATNAASSNTSVASADAIATPTGGTTVVDPAVGTITILPSNKPPQPWHRSTDNNLRPLVIKSMIMKHKDYEQHRHEPAWIASRRKGCEIFEAMQYYNCRSREEYMAQAGVNVC